MGGEGRVRAVGGEVCVQGAVRRSGVWRARYGVPLCMPGWVVQACVGWMCEVVEWLGRGEAASCRGMWCFRLACFDHGRPLAPLHPSALRTFRDPPVRPSELPCLVLFARTTLRSMAPLCTPLPSARRLPFLLWPPFPWAPRTLSLLDQSWGGRGLCASV